MLRDAAGLQQAVRHFSALTRDAHATGERDAALVSLMIAVSGLHPEREPGRSSAAGPS